VDSKWQGIRKAFRGFNPETVSRFTIEDIDALVTDSRIIRNRRKIEAIIENAQRMLVLENEYGGFRKYLRSFSSYEELVKDLKKQFWFMGDSGAYAFLWVVGEKVPPWEEWNTSRLEAKPRMSMRSRRTAGVE
jgi:DNA-3-methyladenine glycosylase I